MASPPGFDPQPQLPDPDHPHAVAEVQHPDGTDSYAYDASGSQTQRTEDGVTYNQTVDGTGQLVSVQNTTTGETWTFAYDGDGNRIRQVNPDGTTTLFLAGGLYEVTLDAGGQEAAVKRYYAIGGQPIALRDAGGTFYLLTDHLGSVVTVLDATGAVVGEQRYRPFGQPRLTPGITQTDRGFTGQQSLSAAGLVDFNARWVDASLGMFSSPDSLIPSLFNPQALNRYAYVANNPLRYTDPTGQMYIDNECGLYGEQCGGSVIRVAARTTSTTIPSTAVTEPTDAVSTPELPVSTPNSHPTPSPRPAETPPPTPTFHAPTPTVFDELTASPGMVIGPFPYYGNYGSFLGSTSTPSATASPSPTQTPTQFPEFAVTIGPTSTAGTPLVPQGWLATVVAAAINQCDLTKVLDLDPNIPPNLEPLQAIPMSPDMQVAVGVCVAIATFRHAREYEVWYPLIEPVPTP